MSYITFDYSCRECKQIDSRMVKREDMDDQKCDCRPHKLTPMNRMPAGTRTTFRFADRKLKR